MKSKIIITITSIIILASTTAFKGHQNHDQYHYRSFHALSYRILDSTEFFLYYRYQQQEHIKGKELLKTDCYYFSINALAPIEPLTIENLKAAFPDNNRFHYLLDEQFRRDTELMAYDPYSKMYKIKYLYGLSLK
jgi:hypothetical protein